MVTANLFPHKVHTKKVVTLWSTDHTDDDVGVM